MKDFEKYYNELRASHPGAVLIFRRCDDYVAYEHDAGIVSALTGFDVARPDGGMAQCTIGRDRLNVLLSRLVYHRYRVAIVDQVDEPRTIKRGEPLAGMQKNS